MPGRKRSAGAGRRRVGARGQHPTHRRRSPRGSGKRPGGGWLVGGAVISFVGGTVAAITMLGATGRLDAAVVGVFAAFAALALVLALLGLRQLRPRRRR